MRTTKYFTFIAALPAFALLAASEAKAAEPSSSPHFFISAERLVGVNFWSEKAEKNNQSTESSGTSLSLLASNGGGGKVAAYQAPRLAFDYRFDFGLTAGGAFGYFANSGKDKESGGQETDRTSTSGIVFAPRVGYQYGLMNNQLILWGRAGVTYFSASSETGGQNKQKTTQSGFALTVEPTVLYMPWKHLGFHAGLNVDLGLGGTEKPPQGEDKDYKATNIGIALGLTGAF